MSERLQTVTEALAAAHTEQKVFQTVLTPAPQALNAVDATVLLVDRAGRHLKVAATQGHEPLTLRQRAEIVSRVTGRSIEVQQIPLETVTAQMPRSTLIEAYGSDSLERMFTYCSRHGLTGSSNVLGWVQVQPPVPSLGAG